MSVFHRLVAGALTGALDVVGVLVVGTAPAAADHVVDVRPGSCTAGPISVGIGLTQVTTASTSTVLPDGSTRWTCTFTGLPLSTTSDENGYFDWQRPQRALRTHVSCGTQRTLMFEGVALFTPSGMLRVVCVEPA